MQANQQSSIIQYLNMGNVECEVVQQAISAASGETPDNFPPIALVSS